MSGVRIPRRHRVRRGSQCVVPGFAVAAAVVGVAGFTAAATAGDQKRDFETDLIGYEEVPSVSTTGGGQVDAEVNRDGTALHYTLHYRNLESAVQQSHIHFGQEGVNGGIVVFLCTNLGNGPAGTPCPCPPPPATVEGDADGGRRLDGRRRRAAARTQGIAGRRVRRARPRDARGRDLRQRAQRPLARRGDPRPVRHEQGHRGLTKPPGDLDPR